ncbi:hmg box protein [Niveomyces insectorum RCEF 264]|uniref:Hmg box protein n=1 Tax=Niveomyces insectorum RCEF 264 TaxID=1081102 RepID=A0A167U0Z3_9HYPO|nr:hmg box protein [Niveomyces insectorum RCEF 264]
MEHAIPPSPPSSLFETTSGVQNQFPQHEEIDAHPRFAPTPFHVAQLASGPSSRYQTPEPPDRYHHFGVGMAYTQPHQGQSHGYPDFQSAEDAGTYELVHGTPAPHAYNLNTPEASPPMASQQLSNSPNVPSTAATPRATQGMRVLGVQSGRIRKASPSKRKTASQSASPPLAKKDKVAKTNNSGGSSGTIDQPLSVLTKDWDMPSVDIDAYVRRSADERQQEVERGKVPGKIKRAMNAFMLYRKAYQDGAKRWAQQSNHQIVSKVCGRSWSMEPASVRRQFNEWAVLERDNHRKAHPEYKFTPSKPRKKGKDDPDDESDLDDPEWGGRRNLGGKYRSASRTPMDDGTMEYEHEHAQAQAHLHSGGGGVGGGGFASLYAPAQVADVSSFPSYHHGAPQHLPHLARHAATPYDANAFAGGAMHYHPVPAGHEYRLEDMAFAHSHQQNAGFAPMPHPSGYQHGYGLGGQYAQLDPAMVAQPLGGVPSHGSSSHAMHAAGLSAHVDPSLMGRDGLPRYDLANPVFAASNLEEPHNWQSGLPVSAGTSDYYPGPYLAEVDESFMQDAHLQYLRGDLRGDEESWKVGRVDEIEDLPTSESKTKKQ